MVAIKAIALSLLAPAGAIVAGVLLQQLLVWVWPGVQTHAVLDVSLDTYFGAVAISCLTFWAGLKIRRGSPGRAMIALAVIFPAIWLLLMQFAVYPVVPSFSAVRVVYTAIAVAPLVAIGLAYALPSNNRWRGP